MKQRREELDQLDVQIKSVEQERADFMERATLAKDKEE